MQHSTLTSQPTRPRASSARTARQAGNPALWASGLGACLVPSCDPFACTLGLAVACCPCSVLTAASLPTQWRLAVHPSLSPPLLLSSYYSVCILISLVKSTTVANAARQLARHTDLLSTPRFNLHTTQIYYKLCDNNNTSASTLSCVPRCPDTWVVVQGRLQSLAKV